MDDKKNDLETLEGLEENPYAGKTTDINKQIFQSLSTYQTANSFSQLNDNRPSTEKVKEKKLKKEVKEVKEKKEAPKERKFETAKPINPNKTKGSVRIPIVIVLLLIIIINLGWYFAVKTVIIPDYETYNKESKELKEKIEILESKVKAITGE